jgi:hypothetical protein
VTALDRQLPTKKELSSSGKRNGTAVKNNMADPDTLIKVNLRK